MLDAAGADVEQLGCIHLQVRKVAHLSSPGGCAGSLVIFAATVARWLSSRCGPLQVFASRPVRFPPGADAPPALQSRPVRVATDTLLPVALRAPLNGGVAGADLRRYRRRWRGRPPACARSGRL